jgi:ApeA N-terminal domain 1/Apea-like HEPN
MHEQPRKRRRAKFSTCSRRFAPEPLRALFEGHQVGERALGGFRVPLDETVEHQGVWFVPEKPTNQVTGKLTFSSNDGALLELIGSLNPGGSGADFSPSVIHGFSAEKGTPITLLDSIETASNFRSSRGGTMVTSSLRPTFVLIGWQFESREAVLFDEAYLRFSHLEQWGDMPGFNISFDLEGAAGIEYRRPDDVPFFSNDSWRMDLVTWPTLPSLEMVQTKATISHRVSIRVRPREAATLEAFTEITRQLQQFLTILVGEAVVPIALDGRSELAADQMPNGSLHRLPIDVLYQTVFRGSERKQRVLPVEMLLSRSVLGGMLTNVTKAWFDSLADLQPVCDLFLATILNPDMFLDQRFLAIIQALESFHRRLRGGPPEPAHAERLARIYASQDEEDREWLEEKLRYSHEPSLRERLKDLLDEFQELAPYIARQSLFIQRVVVTRNYHTHYDESLKETALKGAEMYDATEKLRGLLTVALLRHWGIPTSRIEEILRGHSRSARYLRLAAARSNS